MADYRNGRKLVQQTLTAAGMFGREIKLIRVENLAPM